MPHRHSEHIGSEVAAIFQRNMAFHFEAKNIIERRLLTNCLEISYIKNEMPKRKVAMPKHITNKNSGKKSEHRFPDCRLLIHGDNLDAISFLKKDPKIYGKVRLIYADPPYGTKQSFTVTDDRISTISRVNGGRVAYNDSLSGKAYLDFLGQRLSAIRDLLADDGSIYLHIDSKMGHYVKCLMDEIFGQEHFINDITRIKCNPKNFARNGYGNIKDMVLFYSKTKKNIWNNPRQSIQIDNGDLRFRSVDAAGRLYTTTPLHAPGETTNGATGQPWKGILPPPGRHWRYQPNLLDKLDKEGLVEWSSTGNPRKKIYADEVMKAGVKVQDVWVFKDPQNPKYPTEKNLEMLKMIVEASSEPNDIVLDPFCGSGTTLVAAQSLGRKWIGIDSSKEAISLCKKRLYGLTLIDLTKNQKELLG
ncbi:MAG: site-specific DNA-methyltransferase [candidate division Zixibacteria bacterium]|nr:site-specific DNA-methyltransferase [candidate division Zixibacteria bacterium]